MTYAIITIVIIICLFGIIMYKLGKKSKENELLNNNNKLKKLYEGNNISNVNTVIDKLDKGKF